MKKTGNQPTQKTSDNSLTASRPVTTATVVATRQPIVRITNQKPLVVALKKATAKAKVDKQGFPGRNPFVGCLLLVELA
jgi:hypothetical protein